VFAVSPDCKRPRFLELSRIKTLENALNRYQKRP
jgi:hypothetical protein